MLEYFTDWTVEAIPRNYPLTKDPVTKESVKGVPVDGDPISGVKYNRSTAERYFSQTWAADITDVFVTATPEGLDKTSILVYNGVEYELDGPPTDEGEQGEVYTVGLKVIV